MTRKRRLAAAIGAAALLGLPGTAKAQEGSTLTLQKSKAAAGTVVDDWGGLIDCGLTCSSAEAFYPRDCETEIYTCLPAVVTLTATRQPGWNVSWAGCTSHSGDECSVTMNVNKTVTASFTDVQNPTVAVTSPASGSLASGVITVAAAASDNDAVARVDFRVRGALVASDSVAPYAVSADTRAFADGLAEVSATAVDLSGRSSIAARSVTIDNTAPAVSITGGPADNSTIGPPASPTFTFTATDATSGPVAIECAADGAFGPCTGPGSMSLPPQEEGPHTFSVRATDGAGNVSAPVARTFTVDLTAPETSITGGPADGSSSTSTAAEFTFSASENGATFACRLYAAGSEAPAFGACSGPGSAHAATGLAPGDYVFEVAATDAVGNLDGTPARRSFVVTAAGGGGTDGAGTGGGGTDGGSTGGGGTDGGTGGATPSPTALRTGLSRAFKVSRSRTLIRRLAVLGVPEEASVAVRCKGKGCPFSRRGVRVRAGKAALTRAFARRRLRPGAVVEIRVTAPGAIGQVFRIAIRRKKPRVSTLCLPPGATVPERCG